MAIRLMHAAAPVPYSFANRYMPAMSYTATPLPGINLEIVALDFNIVDEHKTCPWIACGKKHCSWGEAAQPGCDLAHCKDIMQRRGAYAFDLLEARIGEAIKHNRQLIVVTHSPTTWYGWWSYKGRRVTDLLNNPRVHITYFGGHVHATDNVTNVNPALRRNGWNDFCVGGGGGWACDDAHTWASQGFVTGVVYNDGSVGEFRFEMKEDSACCFLNNNYQKEND